MEIKGLTDDAYKRVSEGRDQVLLKNRGYGVISITVREMIFAIPLRSKLNHPNGFKTIKVGKYWNGLDYSKALLVESTDIRQESFRLRDENEYNKIIKNKDKIFNDFCKYLDEYIENISDEDKDLDRKFKFTTLQYFHDKLGIT